MTVLETAPSTEDILDAIDEQMRALQEQQIEPRYLLVGAALYEPLCRAISVRFQRGKGRFDQYQFLPIVLDPFREAVLTVLPAPSDLAEGVRAERRYIR